jgi:heat shock protein HslJ
MLVVKQRARLVCSLSALAAAISMAACAETVSGPSTVSPASPAAPAAIVAGAWKLQSLTRSDSTVVNVKEPDRFTLEFLDGGSRVALRVDCNRAAGPYTTSGSTLTVGPALAMTRAFCAETAALGDEYVRVLSGDSSVTASAASLELSSARGTLKFVK